MDRSQLPEHLAYRSRSSFRGRFGTASLRGHCPGIQAVDRWHSTGSGLQSVARTTRAPRGDIADLSLHRSIEGREAADICHRRPTTGKGGVKEGV